MPDALLIITSLAAILLAGIICSWIGKKLRMPDALLLIIAGMLLGMKFRGASILSLPPLFFNALAILALAMVVFDSTVRLRLREIDTFSRKALKLALIWLLLQIVLFSAAAHFILKLSFWPSILIAAMLLGTGSDVMQTIISKSKAVLLLKLESVFITPFTLILPFIVLDLMKNATTMILSDLFQQLIPIAIKFAIGVGTGIFVGIILFKIIQHIYTEVYFSLAIIIAALFAYILAENLGGNGVLAVTALGLFFANVFVKEKPALLTVESAIAKALYIFVLISTGIIIKLPYSKEFFLAGGALFAVYILIRFIAVWLGTEKLTSGEKVFMTLNIPKGIATATVIFVLAVYQIEGISTILNFAFIFLLYSIILSTITTWGSGMFFHENSTR